MLTQQIIQGNVPNGFVVGSETTVLYGTLFHKQFSVGIPLGEVGFVIRTNGYGTVFIQDKWRLEKCEHVRRIGKDITVEQLRDHIVQEINRQMKEIT